ncbi:MAG: NADH-quinone oxidoreductase subunit C [Bacteroidota bacterium]
MLKFEQIFDIVKSSCRHGEAIADETATPKGIKVPHADIKSVCLQLYGNSTTYFDMLSCLTGLDNGLHAGTMEVVYNLYSIPYDHHVMLRVILPRDNPEVDSVSSIWKTADWHEREAFDMYGIKFKDHPDLRRILMPADWDGYPLRKDYKHQEFYRDIKVEY